MAKKFQIVVAIENGVLLENHKTLWFDCDLVTPLGVQVLRQYNSSECIMARKSYTFSYQGKTYGTFSFTTLQEFINYRNDNCISAVVDNCCYLTFGGCYLTINGQRITYNP